ncbi:MAG TPA: hypothetical protein DCW31_11325 [Lactobacillus sp.]|nr:hypothetical protein [Lactobacillus sp.]
MSNEEPYDPDLVKEFFHHDYVDRGMLKWQGYYLSDHTAQLNKQAKKRAEVIQPKTIMTPAEIGQILQSAFANNYAVRLQLYSNASDGHLQPDVVGHIAGYYETQIILEDGQKIDLLNIRNVKSKD